MTFYVCVNGYKGDLAQFKKGKWQLLKEQYAKNEHLTAKSDYRICVREFVNMIMVFCKKNNIDCAGYIAY